MVHAGVYSGLLHYLKAVEAAKSKDSAAVMAKMKETPTDDPLFGKGTIRVNGRKAAPIRDPSKGSALCDGSRIFASLRPA